VLTGRARLRLQVASRTDINSAGSGFESRTAHLPPGQGLGTPKAAFCSHPFRCQRIRHSAPPRPEQPRSSAFVGRSSDRSSWRPWRDPVDRQRPSPCRPGPDHRKLAGGGVIQAAVRERATEGEGHPGAVQHDEVLLDRPRVPPGDPQAVGPGLCERTEVLGTPSSCAKNTHRPTIGRRVSS
jgi:hypothetical protein